LGQAAAAAAQPSPAVWWAGRPLFIRLMLPYARPAVLVSPAARPLAKLIF
jgi:hypothetical protein